MRTQNPLDILIRHLFADSGAHVYAVLDGAAIPDLSQVLQEYRMEPVCLYRGTLIPELARVAPYLFNLQRESPFTMWLLQQSWERHWGIFALARSDWRPMREHLCNLGMVYDPDGRPLYFRYYDPRVLRVYLPSCDAEDLQTLFGPISCLLCEDEDGALLKFQCVKGQLRRERVELKALERPQTGESRQSQEKE